MADLSKLNGLEIVGSDEHGYTVRNPATGEEWFEPKTPKGDSKPDLQTHTRKRDLKWNATDIVRL